MSLNAPFAIKTPTSFLNSLISTLSNISDHHGAILASSSEAQITGSSIISNTGDPFAPPLEQSKISAQHAARVAQNQSSEKSSSTQSRQLPPQSKDILLTLHALFPHVLLDALDLLDRGCVVRLVIDDTDTSSDDPSATASAVPPESHKRKRKRGCSPAERTTQNTAYHVFSARSHSAPSSLSARGRYARDAEAQSAPSAGISDTPRQSYHVHLRAWNCSCPAFALAAFSKVHGGASVQGRNFADNNNNNDPVSLGGVSLLQATGADQVVPPLCKHLLACLLAETCPDIFGPFAGGDVAEETPIENRKRWRDVQMPNDGRKGLREVVVKVEVAAGLAGGGAGAGELLSEVVGIG